MIRRLAALLLAAGLSAGAVGAPIAHSRLGDLAGIDQGRSQAFLGMHFNLLAELRPYR